MTVGTKVKVFGKRLATVVALSSNGKRVLLAGDYNGWQKLDNVREAS